MGTIIWYSMLIYATWVTLKWRKAEKKAQRRRVA